MSQLTQRFPIAYDSSPGKTNAGFRGMGYLSVLGDHVLFEGKVPAHIGWKLAGGFVLFLVLGTITEIISVNIAGTDHSPITVLIPLFLAIWLAGLYKRNHKVEFLTEHIKDFERAGHVISVVAVTGAHTWVITFSNPSELQAKAVELALTGEHEKENEPTQDSQTILVDKHPPDEHDDPSTKGYYDSLDWIIGIVIVVIFLVMIFWGILTQGN